MSGWKRILLIIVWVYTGGVYAEDVAGSAVVQEDFSSLDSWEPVSIKNVERQSAYRIVESSEAMKGKILKSEADRSASGLGHTTRFRVNDHQFLRWRWKVDNVFPQAKASEKSGDDYALRVQVCFFYDSKKSSLFGSVKRLVAEAAYGKDIPYRVLQYVWANQSEVVKPFENPYTGEVYMIPVRSGEKELGRWITEERDVLKDYKKVFGEEPPAEARLAIMADGDNAGGKSTAWLDWIEVSAAGKVEKP